MTWLIVVLLLKGRGDYRGIGLLEPFWKVVEVITEKRLQIISFHDSLHGFLSKQGVGTTTMETKLAQQLAYLEQKALYMVFIDMRKAYDAMNCGRCLEILEMNGVGPYMLRLISYFWDNAELFCQASGYYGVPFKAH